MNDLWHGSELPHRKLVAGYDGGIHLGTRNQAEMRNSAFLHRVSFCGESLRRTRDRGLDWRARIARARSDGVDGLVYLNRYEGTTNEEVFALSNHDDPDKLSDKDFRKLVPSSQDSLIALHEQDVSVREIIPGRGRVLMYHGTSVENANAIATNGFSSAGWRVGANLGRRGYLYLTNDEENARWFAEQTGDPAVISLSVRACDLIIDPEDASEDSVVDELSKNGLPAYLATVRPVEPHLIRVLDNPERDYGMSF